MKVLSSKIPVNSVIRGYLPVDYHDTFLCTIDRSINISSEDIMVVCWTTMPKWLNILYKIRDSLVKPFGLQTEKRVSEQIEQAIRNGTDYQIISVVKKNDNETIISLNDKHLIAYLSIYIEDSNDKKIYLTTLVKFHNKLGFIYFYLICPFHIIVVKNMIKLAIKNLLLANKTE